MGSASVEGLPPTHPSGFPREGFQGGGDELGGGGGGWVEAVNVLTTPRTERDPWAEDDVSQREAESSGYLSVSGSFSKDLFEAPLPPPPPLCVCLVFMRPNAASRVLKRPSASTRVVLDTTVSS